MRLLLNICALPAKKTGCAMSKKKSRKILIYTIVFAVIPITLFVGAFLFAEQKYLLVSSIIALLSCIPFFLSFEKKETSTQRIVILSVMTALSVAGRFLFSYAPSFKPVTAVVMICGMYMGSEAGFICGALSAFISNFIFMQGPWTPFQMFIWGVIGFVSGVLAPLLKKNKVSLAVGGVLAGIVYSMFMDIWTALWWENSFSISRYITAVITAVPVTVVYAVSNVIFLLILTEPIGRKLERVKKKYGE